MVVYRSTGLVWSLFAVTPATNNTQAQALPIKHSTGVNGREGPFLGGRGHGGGGRWAKEIPLLLALALLLLSNKLLTLVIESESELYVRVAFKHSQKDPLLTPLGGLVRYSYDTTTAPSHLTTFHSMLDD